MVNSKRSEKIFAYLLVAPSLLLIFLIAIWPVIQSFYFSLFDLRLNDPTKSSIHWNHSLDLEQYLSSYPFLISALDNEIKQASGETKSLLKDVQQHLQEVDQKIQEDQKAKEMYDRAYDKVFNLEPVPEEERFITIEKEVAIEFDQAVQQIQEKLLPLEGKEILLQEKRVIGLATSLQNVVVKPNFIGLKHYKDNFQDTRMWKAIGVTTVFTVISVAVELVLGLGIALLINKAFFGRGLVRASILIPWAIPTAVSALMWRFLYDGQNGIVAKYFEEIGLVERMSELLTTGLGAMFAVIFADVWKTTPYMALLLLAGLQTIPNSLYEAASIDGASKWKQFVHITLPLLKPSILVALLFRTLDAFRVFDLIYVLTGGGPANSTETITILAYKVMFSQTNFGEGSALSVVVFICVAIISIIYIKLLGADLVSDTGKK
ncbi:ABC transporter permease subunit [Aeribacillus pallidus]|uniref:carbohydrate ABC transporter permease n=1 Tax=Aeribacillus pallidus TaxID=33936 RepID=UPI003D1D9CA3